MVVLRNASDAYVDESRPNKNFSDTRKMFVKATGGSQKFAYIFFSRPFPLGSVIISAKLRVYNGSLFEGAATLQVNRIREKWSRNRITWNNRPAVFSTTKTKTKTDAAAGTEWEIDVTNVIQSVSDGGVWYGFRITTDNGAGEWFHSAQSKEEYRPQLEITWSDEPSPPEDLRPDGGRVVGSAKPTLRFDFTDVNGDTDLAAVKVEIASTKAILEAGNAEWKSPEAAVTEPELELAATTYPGLGSGSTAWWRVQVKDGGGLWSGWSASGSFKYVPLQTVTLNNPPVGGTVDESTPPILWTTSGVQRAYQIIIVERDRSGDWKWTSGKITSTAQAVTLPNKVLKRDDTYYKIILKVWDNEDREKTPDSPAYASVEREFLLDYDPTTDPVTGLTATPDTPWPWMKIEWDRASAPDRFEIWRDGEVVDIVLPADVFVSGTHYQYKDRFARGREQQTWKVVAVVEGQGGSKTNPTVSGTPQASSRWLMDLDGTDAICILNPNVEINRAENSTVHRTLSGKGPVLISQSLGGYEGKVSGVLADEAVPGLTARQMRDRFKRMRREAGQTLILFNIDEVLEGFIRNATYTPIARSGGGTDYAVSFEFYEVEK